MPNEPAVQIIRTNPSAPIVKRLDKLVRDAISADELKERAAALRDNAKAAFFDWLDAEFGTSYQAVYGASPKDIKDYRLQRSITEDRTVDVVQLAKLVPPGVFLDLVTVTVTALDKAVAQGRVEADVASKVTGTKTPASKMLLLKPAAKIKVPVSPGEVAYWLMRAAEA